MEVWKDIEGYEGYYQVSSEGRIKSLERIVKGVGNGGEFDKLLPEKILKLQTDKYTSVNLHKDGVGHRVNVHRLVAMAFIPNPDNLPEVNHKDECKTNNRVENLEWCSTEYNQSYGTKNQRISEKAKLRVGEKNPFFGKHHKEETKKLISKAKKGKKIKPFTEDHKRKMSEAWKKRKSKSIMMIDC